LLFLLGILWNFTLAAPCPPHRTRYSQRFSSPLPYVLAGFF
jgi:hypothetical protein